MKSQCENIFVNESLTFLMYRFVGLISCAVRDDPMFVMLMGGVLLRTLTSNVLCFVLYFSL